MANKPRRRRAVKEKFRRLAVRAGIKALAAIRTAHAQFLQGDETEPTTEELSQATGFSRAQLESLLAANRAPRSLEQELADQQLGERERIVIRAHFGLGEPAQTLSAPPAPAVAGPT